MGEDLARALKLLMQIDDEATKGLLGNSRRSLIFIKSVCSEAKEILQNIVTIGDMDSVR